MINAQYEVIIVASLTAMATAIPGTFLVLRRMSMLADAISHSIILGIVLAFFFVQSFDSPVFLISAAMTGLLTVFLVEALLKTRLVKEDAAIGVVYPLLFSLAVIIISVAGATHVNLDVEAVLTGELEYAPLSRFFIHGIDVGPAAAWQIGGILIINTLLLLIFYKEIRMALFDPNFAKVSGFSPAKIHYGLMVVTSVTTVAAFEVAGAIMVVGFIVGPAVIASYFSKRLLYLLLLAPIIGVAATVFGYGLAHSFEVSITGSIISVIGIFFILASLFAPDRGFISGIKHRKQLKTNFNTDLLLVHLLQHELIGDADEENRVDILPVHFGWEEEYLDGLTELCKQKKLISEYNYLLTLLPAGEERAREAVSSKRIFQ
jgi:manganese/zinc/iron transport system permease protein